MLISKPSKRPDLHDAVKIAGCSYQTASRVMNDNARVSEETRERVLTAVEAIGYRCSAAARVLVTSRPGAIGVVNDGSWCYGPMGVLHRVGEATRNAGHSMLLTAQERDTFRSLEVTSYRFADVFVNGIVVITPLRAKAKATREAAASSSWASGLSVVMLTPGPRPTPDIRIVTKDQKFGARLATRRLVRLGHQHIVYLADNQKWLDGSVRLEGWRGELLSSGLPAPEPILGDWTGQSGYHAGTRTIKEGLPDAVFVASDLMALGMMRAFNEVGVRVPEDVSVVSFDNHEFARQFFPPLTAVRQDFRALDLRCLKILLSGSDDDHLSEPIRPCLLVRLSACRKARPQPRTGRTRQHVGSATSGFPARSRLARVRRADSLASTPIVHSVTP